FDDRSRHRVKSRTDKSRIHRICFSLTLWFLRGAQDPIPSRTRPSNSSAPMVLSLKAWESRSLQGLPKTYASRCRNDFENPLPETAEGFCVWGLCGPRAAIKRVDFG